LFFATIFFYFSLRNWTADQDQNWGKDNAYLERSEVKFQRDLLRGLGERHDTQHQAVSHLVLP